jgi:hypothetical protein
MIVLYYDTKIVIREVHAMMKIENTVTTTRKLGPVYVLHISISCIVEGGVRLQPISFTVILN